MIQKGAAHDMGLEKVRVRYDIKFSASYVRKVQLQGLGFDVVLRNGSHLTVLALSCLPFRKIT